MKILRKFFSDRRGNVAIMFSLAVVGVVGLVGLAIDYSRATSVEARITSAVDAAVLAGARGGDTQAERVAVANKVFQAALGNISGTSNIVFTPADVIEGGKIVGFKATGNVRLDTMFGKMYGQPNFDIGLFSQAVISTRKRLEMALVLDSTGSMKGSKIEALKTAAK